MCDCAYRASQQKMCSSNLFVWIRIWPDRITHPMNRSSQSQSHALEKVTNHYWTLLEDPAREHRLGCCAIELIEPFSINNGNNRHSTMHRRANRKGTTCLTSFGFPFAYLLARARLKYEIGSWLMRADARQCWQIKLAFMQMWIFINGNKIRNLDHES